MKVEIAHLVEAKFGDNIISLSKINLLWANAFSISTEDIVHTN